jgi:hypothetical protein
MAKIKSFSLILGGVFGASAWFHPAVAGSDLWWHLASGRQILELGRVPSTDSFSFSFQGREWMNHEWLWDFLYWCVFALEPQAVAWLNLGVLFAVFGMAFALARRASGSLAAGALTVCLAAAASHWFLDIRPHLFTLLFLGVFLMTRERPWAPWSWAPLIVLWTNVHAGFVFGFGAIGLHALVETLRASQRAGHFALPHRLWIGVALCVPAMLANPWGWRIFEYPLAYLPIVSDTSYRELIEWKPPGFGLPVLGVGGPVAWLGTFQGRFWLLASAALAGAVRSARREPYPVALAAVAFAMALNSRRFIPLFAVCSAPLVAIGLVALAGVLRQRFAPLAHPRVAHAAAALAVVALLWLWKDVRFQPDLLGQWTQRDVYPEAAVRYLRELGPPARLLNHYNWGGYVMLHLPETRIWIDGRANTLYDERIFEDYRAFLSGDGSVRGRLASYPADAALIPSGSFEKALRSLPSPWRPVYRDSVAVILLPPGSPLLGRPLPDANTVVGGMPQYDRVQVQLLAAQGRYESAEQLAQRGLARDPLLIGLWTELALVQARQGAIDDVEATLAAARRIAPRRAYELWYFAGSLYRRLGQRERAVRALRAGLNSGPFVDIRSVQAQIEDIEQLERELDNGSAGGTRRMENPR